MAGLFEELKRRNVVRVGIAYLVAAWLVLQVIDLVTENIGTPPWVMQMILVMAGLGLPVALIFAWAFEMTPEGVKREKDVDRSQSITPQTGRKLDRLIIVVLVFAVGVLLLDKFLLRDSAPPAKSEQAAAVEPPSETSRRSIAVLPFANRSSSADDVYFVDGIHDDILTHLSKISALKVISRTSVLQYRDTERPMRDIGEELGVATILEGAVQRAGDRVRINVQLIDATTDEHLWAEIYNRELTVANIFEIQSEMAIAIAGELEANLTRDEQERLAKRPTENLDAYEAYLLGRQRMAVRTTRSIAEAKAYFERAINLDPEFALAYVGISDTIQLQVDYAGWSPVTVAREAMPYVTRALELDPESGEAYISLASTYEYGGDKAKAEEAYLHGLELIPNYAQGRMWYGLYLMHLKGHPAEAYEQFRLANIYDPLSAINYNNLSAALRSIGRFDEANAVTDKAFEIDPHHVSAFQFRAYGYWTVEGRLDIAAEWLLQAIELDPGNPVNLADLGTLFMELRDEDRAMCWIDRASAVNSDSGAVLRARTSYAALNADKALALEYGIKVPPNAYGRYYWALPLSIVKSFLLEDEMIEEARALYEEFFPELPTDASGAIDRTNFHAAIDISELLLLEGEDAEARQLLANVESYISSVPRLGDFGHLVSDVRIHALRGDIDLALRALRQAVDENWRTDWRFFMEVDTVLEPLRSHPEFDAIYREISSDMAAQLESVLAKETLETSCVSD